MQKGCDKCEIPVVPITAGRVSKVTNHENFANAAKVILSKAKDLLTSQRDPSLRSG
jgi:hypothetical protein